MTSEQWQLQTTKPSPTIVHERGYDSRTVVGNVAADPERLQPDGIIVLLWSPVRSSVARNEDGITVADELGSSRGSQ